MTSYRPVNRHNPVHARLVLTTPHARTKAGRAVISNAVPRGRRAGRSARVRSVGLVREAVTEPLS
jgi:hypothetical protein